MMQAGYTAMLGVMAQQSRVDTIADNIANISTLSFKSKRVDFKDVLYAQLTNPAGTGGTNMQMGHGVVVAGISRDNAQGVPENTGHHMDFYIDGEGFFAVDAGGETRYTRAGYFGISVETGGSYLVTAQGHYVLDNAGSRIAVPEGELTVGPDGSMSRGDEAPFATLGIVKFSNVEGLVSVGQSMYAATDASGNAQASDAEVLQGFLEGSNVDMSLEMTRLIRAQRAFSLVSSALKAADDMDALANQLRR